jgi:hypothetical protein
MTDAGGGSGTARKVQSPQRSGARCRGASGAAASPSRHKVGELPVEEFIRRFLLHVLPESFVRIRYFGLLSNRHRKRNLARCREWLTGQPVVEIETSSALTPEDWRARLSRLTGRDPTVCPVCGRGHLRLVEELPAVPFGASGRSPP